MKCGREDSRQKYEMYQIIETDTTSFSKSDRSNEYYIISTAWLSSWVEYVQFKTDLRPGLIRNEFLMKDNDPLGCIVKGDLKLKVDYRLINFSTWAKLSTWYGISGPSISVMANTHDFTDNSRWNIEIAKSQKMRIELVPHVHSLKNCNRKQFVCDTPGTYRERERVRYCGGSEDNLTGTDDITWLRGKMRKKYDFSSIAWEECKLGEDDSQQTYVIKLHDYQNYLKVCSASNPDVESNVVGPCDIQTPFCQDVIITGTPAIGNVLKAKIVYWGGIEGSSEYSWIRIVKGKREKFNVKPSNPKIPLEEITDDMVDDDIRCYRLTAEDVGSKIKVQVCPIREDGLRGESKTSMACKILDSVIKK